MEQLAAADEVRAFVGTVWGACLHGGHDNDEAARPGLLVPSQVVWWCLIAQPVVVRRLPHQILVAEPVQFLGRDVHPRRFRRGRGWGFGVHSGDCPGCFRSLRLLARNDDDNDEREDAEEQA